MLKQRNYESKKLSHCKRECLIFFLWVTEGHKILVSSLWIPVIHFTEGSSCLQVNEETDVNKSRCLSRHLQNYAKVWVGSGYAQNDVYKQVYVVVDSGYPYLHYCFP